MRLPAQVAGLLVSRLSEANLILVHQLLLVRRTGDDSRGNDQTGCGEVLRSGDASYGQPRCHG